MVAFVAIFAAACSPKAQTVSARVLFQWLVCVGGAMCGWRNSIDQPAAKSASPPADGMNWVKATSEIAPERSLVALCRLLRQAMQ